MSLNFKTPMLHQDYNFSSSQLMFEGWTGWTWVLGLGQSLLNYVGVVLILLALRHVSPTQNKVIRSFQVVASYTLQVELLTWHRRPPCAAPGDPVRHAAARLGLRGCGAHHGRRHGQRHRDRGHGEVQGQAAVHLTFSSHAVYLSTSLSFIFLQQFTVVDIVHRYTFINEQYISIYMFHSCTTH